MGFIHVGNNNALSTHRVYLIFFPPSQWKDAKPEDLMDSKLRCVFELPSENEKLVSSAVLAPPLTARVSSREVTCRILNELRGLLSF